MTIKTVETVKLDAEKQFQEENPKPTSPTPPSMARPALISIGDARAWMEVRTFNSGWNVPKSVQVQFIVTEKSGSDNRRIDGLLTAEEIDAFIGELQRAKEAIHLKQSFLDQNEEYEKQLKAWESQRDVHVRVRVQDFERANGKK